MKKLFCFLLLLLAFTSYGQVYEYTSYSTIITDLKGNTRKNSFEVSMVVSVDLPNNSIKVIEDGNPKHYKITKYEKVGAKKILFFGKAKCTITKRQMILDMTYNCGGGKLKILNLYRK